MQLNVLPHRQIGSTTGVEAGKIGDRPQLIGSQKSVGNSNPQHEERQRQALAIFAAYYSRTIALCVNSPPAEVGANPFGRNGSKAFSRKTPNLRQSVPRIHGPLQPLRFLRFGFFGRVRH
jgi:hypothetical protein